MANYRQEARRAAARYGLDPDIYERQIGRESVNFSPAVISGRQRSPAGAMGIAQFMPETARSLGVNPLNPIEALDAAAKLMADYVKKYGGYEPALRAYNAGPGAIERSRGFKETNDYVAAILGPGRVPDGLEAPRDGAAPASSGGGRPELERISASGSATATGSTTVDTTPSVAALQQLSAALQRPEPPAMFSHLSMPDFAAKPVLPEGYSGRQASAPQGPSARDYARLLTQLQAGTQQSSSVTVAARAAATKTAGALVAAGASPGVPEVGGALVQEAVKRANILDARKLPYKYGGGHDRKRIDPAKTGPLDCSSAVSAVLGVDVRVSGEFEKFGRPGRAPGGKGITIYANPDHVLMEINGRFFGTSKSNPGGGAGWIPRSAITSSYLKNFTARHVS